MQTGWIAVFWVALGGALGSAIRYGTGRLCSVCAPSASPMIATGLVNLVGSFLLGIVVTFLSASPKSNAWSLLLGVGFCGGLTTFSTLAMELAGLMHARRFVDLLGYGIGSLVLGLLAFLAGVWVVGRS